MALSKDKKNEVIDKLSMLLSTSKMTVFAQYSGTSVKYLQDLKRDALSTNTFVFVVKNRLVKKAMQRDKRFMEVDTSIFKGQLMYAFNSDDEVAPAQVIANFAKNQPQIKFIGGLNIDGSILSVADVKYLAGLPSKEQLRGQLAGTIAAPLSGFLNVLAGNVRGVIHVMNARANKLSN